MKISPSTIYYKMGGLMIFMTKKANTKEDNKAEKSAPVIRNQKKILYEAVQEHPTRNYKIVGALTRAGLYKQYRAEEAVYGIENIEPSITDSELAKIIKDYTGE